MTHRCLGRLHAHLVLLLATVVARLRVAPQRGQGTVEYVALILLVAGVLAGAVGLAAKGDFNLGNTIKDQLTSAIGKVSNAKPR